MAMRWRCWRSSKSVTPTGGLSAGPPAAEKAVEAGSKSGEIVLARVLVNRQAGATDVAHAITLLQDAARDSESDAAVDAQMLLGLIYASGVHGPEDDVKASEYFKGSSSLSRTGYAEYWAGMMFQQGEKGFIEPNKQKALHWLNVSCPEGLIPAAKSLTGLVKDKSPALSRRRVLLGGFIKLAQHFAFIGQRFLRSNLCSHLAITSTASALPTTFSAVRAISRIRSTPAIKASPSSGIPTLPGGQQHHEGDARHAGDPFRGHHQGQHRVISCQIERSIPYSWAIKIAAML